MLNVMQFINEWATNCVKLGRMCIVVSGIITLMCIPLFIPVLIFGPFGILPGAFLCAVTIHTIFDFM